MLGQLQGLEIFVIVAQERGFSAAARKLGVSASAASQAVRALEERLGVTLLLRTTRSVNLTEAGQQLLSRVGPALNETNAALRDVKQALGRVQGTFKLTVGRVNVPLVVEPLLRPLLANFPELSIEVSVNDRFVDIVKEGFDAGVRLEEAIEPDLAAVRLLPPFRLLVVGSPAYLALHGRPKKPRDLLGHDCITYRLPATGSTYRWELERAGREEHVAVKGRLVCNDSALMLRAARDGLGLAYLLEPEAAPFIARGELSIVLEDYAPRVAGLFLYFARGAEKQAKVRAFIDTARQVLTQK
ncbi:MAG: Transcriptional regulator, LysR family [Polyangiaceae bacterium]|jgi:DNA-binding transcriptional LysR family regulator|nr:Transcriptional regulator, LysR family [Polyangiaceae bacterium]